MKTLTYILICLSIVLLIHTVSCSSPKNEETKESSIPQNDTNSISSFLFHQERQYGDYLVTVTQKNLYDNYLLEVKKQDSVIIQETNISDHVDQVIVRDLDKDQLLEIYIISLGGSGGFQHIDMYEIDGGPLYPGDIEKLYGAHDFYFTNSQLIHQQLLKKDNSCCNYIGHEFVYFKLVNNTFRFSDKESWQHVNEKAVNESF
jgi:hypothetical protein